MKELNQANEASSLNFSYEQPRLHELDIRQIIGDVDAGDDIAYNSNEENKSDSLNSSNDDLLNE